MIETVPVEDVPLRLIASLVARQQEAARTASAVVPAALTDAAVAEAHVERLLTRGHLGRVARSSGEVVGVLLGRLDGDAAELPAAGFAIDPAAPDPTRVLAELYGELAPDLLGRGATRHYLAHLDTPHAVQAVSDLGFGRISYCGVRPVDAQVPTHPRAGGVTVRISTADDLDTVARLCRVEIDHRYVAPVFSPRPERERTLLELAEAHGELEQRGGVHVIATLDGTDVGVLTLGPTGIEPGLCPDDQPFIGETATVPAARGRGIASAMVETAMGWAADQGHAGVTVSFQPSNRVSRRFWLGAGFVPTGFWAVRRIPESYAARPDH